jgi:tRNA threonylcarbamoyladenosine biosynthesis protein TsaB
VVKGLAFSLNLPVIGVSALEASAYVYRGFEKTVCPVLNAGHDRVAWAQFKASSATMLRKTQDKVTSEDEFIESNGRTTLFCGEGVLSLNARLKSALGSKIQIMDQFSPWDRLTGAAAIGSERLLNGERDNLASLQPHYLMSPTITPPKPPRRIRPGTPAKPK